MHQIDPTAAQRVDRRVIEVHDGDKATFTNCYIKNDYRSEDERDLYIGLHRGVWPLYPGEAAHVATDVDEANTAPRIPRWNESPDYPRGTSPGWTALGLLLLSISGVLSISALVHLAGWLGWLS